MAGLPIYASWKENTNLSLVFYWADKARADGKYKDDWNQHAIDLADMILFAYREVMLAMDIAAHISANHANNCWVELNNTSTSWPDDLIAKNITDYPPHLNAHCPWRVPKNWAGDTNSHFYTDDKAGRTATHNKVNRAPSTNTPTVENVAADVWSPKRDPNLKTVLSERVTAAGHIELRLGTGGVIWQIRKVSQTELDIYRAGQKVRSVKRAAWDVKASRIVIERRDFEKQTLVTETILADYATGKLISRTEVGSSLTPPPVDPVPGESMTTFYVSPNGNDSNAGTLSQPWRSPAKAAATAKAGDIVVFRAGSYPGQLVPANSGVAGKPITFMAYQNERPVIDLGQKTKTTVSGLGVIALRGLQHIVLDGLRAINSGHFGINVDKASKHILLRNCHAENTFASGIMVDGSENVLVENNILFNVCHMIGGLSPNEGISIRGSKNCRVLRNEIDTCGKEGFDGKTGSENVEFAYNIVRNCKRTAFYCDAYDKGVKNIWFHHNLAINSQHGYVLRSEKGADVSDIIFEHNIARDCGYYGLWLASAPEGAAATFKNVTFRHNTCVGNGKAGKYAAMRVNAVKISGLVIERNLFWQNSGGDKVDIQSGLPAGEPKMLNNFQGTADPRFTDMAKDIYTLKAGSPALGTGAFPDIATAPPVEPAPPPGSPPGAEPPPPDPEPEPEPKPEPIPAPHPERLGLDGLAITFEQEPDGDWVMVIRKGGSA